MLDISGLTLEFTIDRQTIRVLDQVSLQLYPGETVCLVGESGSGKSVTAMSIAQLLPQPPARYVQGRIALDGADVLRLSRPELRRIRGRKVSYVFQEPGASLNPVFRVGRQILESLRLHRPKAATDDEVIRLLTQVGIPAPELRMRDYPHQLSGGMQQRVMIAMALAPQPELLVADEPTTALDVTIQAQIMELLAELKSSLGMSILLITHNLDLIRHFADRVVVMYAGQVVEAAPAAQLLSRPAHPYTRALMHSVPRLGTTGNRLQVIPGSPPQAGAFPSGCRFHPRCTEAREDCRTQAPELIHAGKDHLARCPYGKE